MATLLIDIRDVTVRPVEGDTVTLTAPDPRPSSTGGVTRPFDRLVVLDKDGRATVEVDPGPLRVTFHDAYDREVVIDTRVPDEGDTFTLRELIVSEVGDVDDVPGIRESLDGKADVEHEHSIDDIVDLDDTLTGLRDDVDGKADQIHHHEIDDVVDLRPVLSNHAVGIDGKAAAVHTHRVTEIVDLDDALGDKAPVSHTHEIMDVRNLESSLGDKADANHRHTIDDVDDLTWSLDQKVNVDDLRESVNDFSSEYLARIVDGAPESLDTLREVADEFERQDDAIEAVFTELGKRAMKSHTHPISDVTGLQSALAARATTTALTQGLNAKADRTELALKLDASEVTDVLSSVSYGKVVKREDGGLAIRAGEPEQAYHATTKRYVDAQDAKKADRADVSALSETESFSGDGFNAFRRGSVVTIRFEGLKTGASTTSLPATMRPLEQTYCALSDLGNNPAARAAITRNGEVTGTSISTAGYGIVTYVR